MYKIADINDYRATANVTADTAPQWMSAVTHILEHRSQDDECLEQLLQLLAQHCGLSNVSVAVPEASRRFKARFCTTGVVNGVYSFAVQHALCRQFESGEWLAIRDGQERPDVFEAGLHSLTAQHRCLLVPITLRQTVLAVLVMDVRQYNGAFDAATVRYFAVQMANLMATQVVPNFTTLYARPYQRVQENEIDDIRSAIERCNGNKTMAARVLGLTPRQLRYRLAKLEALPQSS
ncbi:hypothetical protein CHH28_19615 [Bacterioplanes sanyensis]|uniref:DNA binding HTH domain-containing protein n=1 Tax=Bacterioplanes sanyensis TaxID=1249553 RepID=A0A222FPV3_9GAMM|nr:helix-turn-helix domain-containing protein [Bacterioplanes sanyensis]ASP40742.1 hypothetical protein CHH28_19615 [Bacterioplanes sanyensis]